MWKCPNDVTNTEIDYSVTNRVDIVRDVTVINQVNIASDHSLDYEQHQIGHSGGKENILTRHRQG